MKNTSVKGQEGEQIAVLFLEQNGHTILERNVRTSFSEIDIITLKEGVIHFVEVKSGMTFEPVYNFTHAKLQKILRGVRMYLTIHKTDMPYTVDLITVKNGICELYENVTF